MRAGEREGREWGGRKRGWMRGEDGRERGSEEGKIPDRDAALTKRLAGLFKGKLEVRRVFGRREHGVRACVQLRAIDSTVPV